MTIQEHTEKVLREFDELWNEYYGTAEFYKKVQLFLTEALRQTAEEAYGALGVEGMKEEVRHHESCLNKEYGGSYCDCGHPDQWRAHNQVLSTISAKQSAFLDDKKI